MVRPGLSTVALILSPSTLRLIRDDADALCVRIKAQGYEECPNDIQAASGIAEDIRDALLDYQVGCGKTHTTAVATLNWDTLTDAPATGDV